MHQIPTLKRFSYCLAAFFAESLEAKCQVENEDVVGAAPTGDAPTTSEWSTILLPTKVRLILEFYGKFSLYNIFETYLMKLPHLDDGMWLSLFGKFESLVSSMQLTDSIFQELYTFMFFVPSPSVHPSIPSGAQGMGGAVRFLVVGTIGKEERPPRGQLCTVRNNSPLWTKKWL